MCYIKQMYTLSKYNYALVTFYQQKFSYNNILIVFYSHLMTINL